MANSPTPSDNHGSRLARSDEQTTMPTVAGEQSVGRPAASSPGLGRARPELHPDAELGELPLDSIRHLMEHLHLGLLIQGPAGEVSSCNADALEMIGLTIDELHGRAPLPDGFRIERHDGGAVESGLAALLAPRAGEPTRDLVLRVHRPRQDDLRWVTMSSMPEHDAHGALVRIVTTLQDVTERQRMQEALAEARRVESMGRLAGRFAHDFNNILTVIRGTVELAVDELPADSPVRGDLEASLEAAARASYLTKQILAFASKQVVRAATVDIGEEVAAMAAALAPRLGADIRITTRRVDGPVHVQIDRGQLEQVLMNLAENARDAMPHGGTLELEIRTGAAAAPPRHVLERAFVSGADKGGASPPGDAGRGGRATLATHPGISPVDVTGWVELRVRDSGLGIPEDAQPMIFDPYFTTKPLGKGTGLGLSTVYGIVRQHGGLVAVSSQVGHGTTFSIYLPSAPTPVVKAVSPSESSRRTIAARSAKILLVDDDPAVRGVTRRVLESRGHDVIEASDGQEALARLYGSDAAMVGSRDADVALMVTDLVMPNMSGRSLIHMVRQRDPKLPIIVVSGHPDDVERGSGGGLEECCLLKPYAAEDLLAAVEAALV